MMIEAFLATKAFLDANWTLTEIRYPNGPRSEMPASRGNARPPPYLLIEFTSNMYEQTSIGSGEPALNQWRESGLVFGHIFVPSGTGVLASMELVAAFAAMMKGVLLHPNIHMGDMSLGVSGPGDDNGSWWCTTVSVEWYRDS